MQHKEVAARVLKAVGGEENIVAAAHCATRLRMVLKDSKDVDQAALDNDPDLKGTFETGGMYQIIVGPGDVNTVFAELDRMTAKNIAVTTEELKGVAANSGSWFTRAVKILADIFVPLIPILVGGGLLMAINNVLTTPDIFGELPLTEQFPGILGAAEMINLIASAPFAFLPVLVGFTATKRFGGNEFLGAGMAMAMVMPSLINGYQVAETIANGEMTYWSVFGLDVAQAGYQGTVLPILVVSWLLAKTENFFHKHLKGTVDFLVTPVLTLLIIGFITFIAVGPAMRWLGDSLALGLANLYEFGGPVGGFLFGLIYSPIVITGLHQSFPPIETMLWEQGGSFIFSTASMANIAQGAVALAVFFLARNEKLKGLAGASGVSAVFGITEPAIFGVNLRLRWPFYIGISAAAIGSTFIALLNVKATALGAAGFIGVVSMRAGDWGNFMICAVLTFVIAFAAAYIYGRRLVAKNGTIDPDATDTPQAQAAAAAAATAAQTATESNEVATEDATQIVAPLTGEVNVLASVSDPMFAQGKLGAGLAIVPTEGKLVSPVSGKVVVAFPSGHAFAVRTQGVDGKNVDILMHIGFDTVNLKGEHFTPLKQQGDEVVAGEVLCEFNIDGIKAAGYEVTTPIVISNSKRTGAVLPATELALPGAITAGDLLLTVNPKVEANV
ncbi:sucrose-specific PTS transporter subunit IIBC [Corynebacterium kutscheri]|uniref:protein-N(pi)-phosphohistidine--sucrose phosphotransferase n=1 Tax=Corynebacterium kutscheri TaxID=35755 RepID=A0A0F6TC89_9CORY|nr:sucrose-specific PTS transporter subunit IIBC [Corynebacterium kutscheri]AKE40566.1 PTS system sucrose-specific IIC component [Corynebacterium kutscheri]VEH10961.1 PTS system sucrose-specific transporter subunit IIBCA [Corynebacterium kutscheri]